MEIQNFNKPSTIHSSLLDFKLQRISHACTIQANRLNLQAFGKLAVAIRFIYNQEQRQKEKNTEFKRFWN